MRAIALGLTAAAFTITFACGSFDEATTDPGTAGQDAAQVDATTALDSTTGSETGDAGSPDAPCVGCTPVTVAPEIPHPYRLGASGGQVFWTDFTRDVWTCEADACVPRTLVPDAGATLKSILTASPAVVGAIDTTCSSANDRTEGEFVFATDGGSLSVRGVPCPMFVAAHGDSVYFTNVGTIGGTFKNWSITRCAPAGCVDLVGSATALQGVGFLEYAVATDALILAATSAGHIVKWDNAAGGAGPTDVVTGGETFHDLATDGTRLAWIDGMHVRACTIAQCAATTYTVTNDTTAQVLAADASGIYWTSKGSGPGDGKVMWLAPGAASAKAIVTGQVSPVAIALDASFVYWANDADATGNTSRGSILRRSKP